MTDTPLSPPPLPRRAIVAFLLTALVLGLILHLIGRLQPVLVNDTPGYIGFPFDSWTAALSDQRTPGYPLFLRATMGLLANRAFVPLAHYAAYALGGFAMLWGLFRLTGECWPSFAAAMSLFATNILHRYAATIATDTLAAAAALCVIGLLCGYLGSPRRSRRRLAPLLALAIFTAWQIRPAYLCLVPLVPLLGVLLTNGSPPTPRDVPTPRRLAVTLTVLAVIPLLGWCLLRWCVVGQFGVVAFGGYNLAGIAGQFLDDDLVPRLSPAHWPLALAALEERNHLPPRTIQMPEADRLNYSRMEANYDITIWSILTPAAQRLYGPNPRDINPELRKLSLEIIRKRPGDYATWLAKSLRQSVRLILSDFAFNPAGFLLLLTGSLALLIAQSTPAAFSPPRPHTLRAILLIALLYAAAQIAITILVCPPLGRFTDAASLFVPSLATLLTLHWSRSALVAFRRPLQASSP